VADSKQFGSPKILQFGDKTAGNQPGDSGHCAQCEAMLADALDGTLSAADQEFFDLHMAQCGPCARGLADARRGAAFLEMLRTPAPAPPADLLERILAQTSGTAPAAIQHAGMALVDPAEGVPAMVHGYGTGYAATGTAAAYGNVIPFRRRFVTAVRTSSFGQLMLQPRLAMTAAMAFFSVALTMNLTGFNPLKLQASDLTPSSLKRNFYAANTRVVQYYEGLRVVYELESRVHDLQNAQDADATAGTQTAAPAGTGQQPAGQTPAAQPGPNEQPGPNDKNDKKAAPQPDGNQQEHSKPAPSPGSSRREDPTQSRRYVAYTYDGTDAGKRIHATVGRKLV
jgi:Putative zinc-finger